MAKKWPGLVASVFAKIKQGQNGEESYRWIKTSSGRFAVLCLNFVIVILSCERFLSV